MPAGTIVFSNTTPAAPSGHTLVTFQDDGGSSVVNQSAYVPSGITASQFLVEEVTITGTSGTLSHAPIALIGIFRNGARQREVGATPDITLSGPALTLNFTPGGTDVFVAVYFY